MKIKRNDFLSVLQEVKPGLASSEMIVQSTSFIFKKNRVITYNDEIAVSTPLNLGGIEGAVVANELVALLSKIRDEEIKVSLNKKGELFLEGNKIKSGISMYQEIHLPILNFVPKEGFYRLPDKFLDGIKICLFSTASESASPILSNIHMKDTFIESCDNFRLTRFDLDEDSQDDFLIPSTGAFHLVNTTVDEYGEEDGWGFFRNSSTDMILACRVYEDEYPNLDPYLKIKNSSKITLPLELSEVLDRSGIFAGGDVNEGNYLVEIQIKNNWIKVSSKNEHGWIEEKIRSKTKNADLHFLVNPDLLRDILKRTNEARMTNNLIRFDSNDFSHVITLQQMGD